MPFYFNFFPFLGHYVTYVYDKRGCICFDDMNVSSVNGELTVRENQHPVVLVYEFEAASVTFS